MAPALASWMLRAGIFFHTLALFLIVFTSRQTQLGNLLFMELFVNFDNPYTAAVFVEKITVSIYLLCGLIVLFKPWWPLLLLLGAYAFLEAYSAVFNAGSRFSELTVAAHALRIGLPMVLLVLSLEPRSTALRQWLVPIAAGLLRVLVAIVFATHGYQALMADPGFIDLIIGTFRNLFGIGISESTTVVILKVIATIDFVVAVAVLLYPMPRSLTDKRTTIPLFLRRGENVILPGLMLWIAGWGLLTAFSRLSALGLPLGFSQYPELFIRASHFLGPLALWSLLRRNN